MPAPAAMKPLVCLLLLAAFPISAPGQESPELTQLRQYHEARALSTSRMLSEQFSKALASLSREAGALGEYELALKAEARRQSLADLYARVLSDGSLSNVIVLRPEEAKVTGSVSYDRSKGTLLGWKAAGNSATWEVRIPAGSYDVTLEYSVADTGDGPSRPSVYGVIPDMSTGGDIEFYEDSSLSGASANRRSATVSDTGGWTEFTTTTLSPINLTRSSARFALKVTRARGEGGVMQLKQIRLSPAKTTPAPAAASAAGEPVPQEDPLVKAQQEHLERLRQKLTPVIQDYSDRLHDLMEGLKGNDDAIEELQAEARRVERLGGNPVALLMLKQKGGRGTAGNHLPDGFSEMMEVRYVSSPENTGDTFQVEHSGETFRVRLLLATCVPLAKAAGKGRGGDAAAFAAYFGVPEEDTTALGEQARDFTTAFVKDRSLRLLTRGLKDAEGSLLVTVQVDGLGDLAGALVDNGLAMLQHTPAKTKAARLYEETALSTLKEREAAAKARPTPPGAWALSEPSPGKGSS